MVVGGLLLIVTLLVRALAMPAEFYARDARGRAALARSKVRTAFGFKALLVFGVVLCVGVVILVIALVSRPLQPRGPRPETAEAEPAGPQENEGPDDRYSAWEEALRERDERLREERESAPEETPESTSPPAAEPAQEDGPESEADPRAFPGMPFSPFGARGSNASDRTYDPPRPPESRSPGEPRRPFGPATDGAGAASGDPDLAGGPGGGPFRTASPDGQPVIGFRYSLGSWADQKAIRRLEPLFRPESPGEREEVLLARDGYAVGALHVDAGQFVRAIRVVFMRITPNGRLDPDDAYTSDWLGSPSGDDPKALGDTGEKVIGIRGRQAAILDAVGLVLEKP
jgi:hypothetical protein